MLAKLVSFVLNSRAFNNIVYRLVFFFIGGALCIGIVVPYTSPLYVSIASRQVQQLTSKQSE